MEDLDSTIWNRNRFTKRANRTCKGTSWKKLTAVIAYITLLSYHVGATTLRPVVNQEIGFAGQLREGEPQSQPTNPNQANNRPPFSNSNNTYSNSQTGSSSNNLDVRARAPLFSSRLGPGPSQGPRPAGQRFFNGRRIVRLSPSPSPSPSPSASSHNANYHPNHRYPDQSVDLDHEKYYVLKKQPTSSIIAETAYYSPARRLELDDHDDAFGHSHKLQQYNPTPVYNTRPSPTPVYRKIYRESPSASPLPALTNFYTKKPTYEDVFSTPQPDPKKYAFAYAVGDRHRGDDYSHRESRDGKVTMGEYKVVLPDGRLQIVRYTADAKTGFKADVTYEGESNVVDKGPGPVSGPSHGPGPSQKPYTNPKAPYYVGPSGSPDLRKQYIESSPSPGPTLFSNYHSSNSPYKSYPSISPSIVYKGTEGPQSYKNVTPYKNPNSITPTPFGFVKDGPPSPSSSSLPKNIYDKIASTKSPYPYSPIPRGFPAGPSSPKPRFDDVNPTPSGGPRRHRKIIDPEPTKNYIPNSTPGGKSRLIPIEHFKAGPYTDSPKEYPKVFRIKPSAYPSYKSPPNGPPQQDDHYLLLEHPDDHQHHHPSPSPHSYHSSPNSNPPPYNPHSYNLPPSPSPTPYSPYPSPSPTPYEIHASPGPGPSSGPFPFDPHRSTEHFHSPARNFISPTPYHSIEQSDSKIPPVKSSLATYTSILGVTPKPVLYIKSKPVVGVGRPVQPSIGGIVYLETPARGIRPNELGVKDYLDRLPQEFDLQRPKTTTHPYQVGSKDYGDSVSYGIKGNKEAFLPSQEDPSDYLIPTQLDTNHFRAHHESAEHHNQNQQQYHHHHNAPEIKKVEHHHHVLVSYPEHSEQNHHQLSNNN